MPEDVAKLKSEVETQIADRAIQWRFPDAPDAAKKNIVSVDAGTAARQMISSRRLRLWELSILKA
jgi:hypothetical protein